MSGNEKLIFGAMVFTAIVLLAAALIVPTVSSAAAASRSMRRRIGRHLDLQEPGTTSLLREQYLKELTPFERWVETLPFVAALSHTVEQSGERTSAAKVLMQGVGLAIAAAVAVQLFLGVAVITLGVAVAVFTLPILNIVRKRIKRLTRFEEQLPEALDIMSRALKAGHPFNETLNLVSEEMQEPIAGEFGRVFSDLNFGLPLKVAFQGILTRIPSLSLHTLVTAVLIQHESGGRLAEILENVAAIIRGRFKLQRRIKTLSAEGRMSAWILSMIPFVLAAILSLSAPTYLPMMLKEPLGVKLVGVSFVMMILGVFWIRKLIRIEV